MAVSAQEFRHAMRQFAAGVTVVTTKRADATPWGFTVTAFSSVSLTPPLVLVCVGEASESYDAMVNCEHFAVNFLAENQEQLSQRFASRMPDRFSGVSHRAGRYGSPLLDGCLGFVECRRVASHTHGDHAVIVGEVMDAAASGAGEPLLHFRGAYGRLQTASDCAR
jgi:flavin reductase (DIM6/NTAB) family NADH-FMN oxidoreductase RutF